MVGTGLWDEEDGFYYDQLLVDGRQLPLRIRSLVGLTPLFTVEVLEEERVQALAGFNKRLAWFVKYRQDLSRHITHCERDHGHALLWRFCWCDLDLRQLRGHPRRRHSGQR